MQEILLIRREYYENTYDATQTKITERFLLSCLLSSNEWMPGIPVVFMCV